MGCFCVTPVSHVWVQAGSVSGAGRPCYEACTGVGVTFRGLNVTRVVGPGGRMGTGNWIQAQRTVNDAAATALVLTELEEADYQGEGWPGPPGRPPRCCPWNRINFF